MRNILFKIYVIILLKTKGEDEVDKWRRTLEIIFNEEMRTFWLNVKIT